MTKQAVQSDTTPLETKVILLIVLALTAIFISMLISNQVDVSKPEDIVFGLWLLTVLFVFRVIGQVIVAVQPQKWLPPMSEWNFIPYPILLPVQLVLIAIMTWVNLSLSMSTGSHDATGALLIRFSYLYAAIMVIRYVRRMYLEPSKRWFGGTIPIVFHFVLASYLYTLGSFYVSQ